MIKDQFDKKIADFTAQRRFVNSLYALVDGDPEMTANVRRLSDELSAEVIDLLNQQTASDTQDP